MGEDKMGPMRPMRPWGWYRGARQTTVEDRPNGLRTWQKGHAKLPSVDREQSERPPRVDQEESVNLPRVDREGNAKSLRVDREGSGEVGRDGNADAGKPVELEV
jgi:hypothetical protein